MTGKDLLAVAVKIEGTGYSYYSKLAAKASGALKSLFEELANQEKRPRKSDSKRSCTNMNQSQP